MIRGVSLAYHLLSLSLIEEYKLSGRCADRGGEREVQFLWSARSRVLPVWDEGRLRLIRWGCRRDESRELPCTGCTWQATVDAGGWQRFRARAVEVPATLVLEGAVWVLVREGLWGLLVTDESCIDHVYLICEPSSYYYRVMTRGEWMPVLIGERF